MICTPVYEAFSQLFTATLEGAGPETRFVFELLAAGAASAAGDVEGYKVKALAVQFRLSQKLVSDALGDLIRLGMVLRQRGSPEGKGRPAITYALSPAVAQTLKASGSVYGVHGELLECLFSGAHIGMEVPGCLPSTAKDRQKVTKAGRPAPPGASKQLSACNRLLFATLLARADHCGVVSGIGGPELRKLTGFDEASLKHRLRRLMDLGLIRRYVPGVSSSIFAKSKVSSTYFLNLNHPGFELKGDCTVMVHLAWNPEDKSYTHTDDLRIDVIRYERQLEYSDPVTPINVIRFWWGSARVFTPSSRSCCIGMPHFYCPSTGVRFCRAPTSGMIGSTK